MNDTIADALQKIAAGGMNASPAAPLQPPAATHLSAAAAEPPQALLPQPPAAPTMASPPVTTAPALPSAFEAFQAIVICPPEPVEIPAAASSETAGTQLGSATSTPPVSPPPTQEKRFKVPARLRTLAASTAQTAAGMQNTASMLGSAGWSDRLRTAAALLLSVGMAWVVWTDLRQTPPAVAANTDETVDVDQLLREFETADHHSHQHDQQIQRMLSEPALKSAPPVMDLDEELAAPRLAFGELPAGKVQRTAAATEIEDQTPVFSEPAVHSDESAAEAVYPDQQPARTPPKAGSGRPLRFTGQIQPMNPPAIAN